METNAIKMGLMGNGTYGTVVLMDTPEILKPRNTK